MAAAPRAVGNSTRAGACWAPAAGVAGQPGLQATGAAADACGWCRGRDRPRATRSPPVSSSHLEQRCRFWVASLSMQRTRQLSTRSGSLVKRPVPGFKRNDLIWQNQFAFWLINISFVKVPADWWFKIFSFYTPSSSAFLPYHFSRGPRIPPVTDTRRARQETAGGIWPWTLRIVQIFVCESNLLTTKT